MTELLPLKRKMPTHSMQKGQLLQVLGQTAEACIHYDRARAVRPDFSEALNNRALAPRTARARRCGSWGHPETSGLPTIDYFLSSEEMEPTDGDSHYSEHLVRLPGVVVYYEPRVTEEVPFTRAHMGLHPGIPAFWCAQSLFKYLPQHDEIYPRIAREVGDCQFAFISYPLGGKVTEQFRARLDRAFAAFGLDASAHCVILSRLDGNQFAAAARQCDVVLDSIGWSGFNTKP